MGEGGLTDFLLLVYRDHSWFFKSSTWVPQLTGASPFWSTSFLLPCTFLCLGSIKYSAFQTYSHNWLPYYLLSNHHFWGGLSVFLLLCLCDPSLGGGGCRVSVPTFFPYTSRIESKCAWIGMGAKPLHGVCLRALPLECLLLHCVEIL